MATNKSSSPSRCDLSETEFDAIARHIEQIDAIVDMVVPDEEVGPAIRETFLLLKARALEISTILDVAEDRTQVTRQREVAHV